jgi:porphobilinogen deaminase
MSKTIYVSSRKSQLAMYQTNEVIGMLQVGAGRARAFVGGPNTN